MAGKQKIGQGEKFLSIQIRTNGYSFKRGVFTRGAKSAATWQPSYHIVYEESGSDRKFLDPSHTISHHQTIWW